MSVELAAKLVLKKYLRKGNMARAMRDILPNSELGYRERDEVARIVHQVVRFKKLYDYALGHEGTPEEYIHLVRNPEIVKKHAERALREGRHDVYFSASPEVARILEQHGDFEGIINTEPDTHLSVNLARTGREDVISSLKDDGIMARRCKPATCVLSEPHARYSAVVKNGLAIVQDASSQLVARLVSSLGDDILDYCAGSGGKSFTMKFFNPDAKISVHDANDGKLKKLFSRAEILGLEFERFNFESRHEVVLVDAPCSGLGSAARNPEAKYRSDLDSFPPLQMEILEDAFKFLNPGGYLVYVVCTFNSAETHELVERFMSKHREFEELSVAGNLKGAQVGGYFTAGDVMYVAVLQRR